MRGLHAHISYFNSQIGSNLALDRQVPVLGIHVVEIGVNGRGTQADAGACREGVLQSDAARRRTEGERHSEQRIGAEPGNNIGCWVLSHNGVSRADRGLAIFERIPGKADARLQVLVVRVIGLAGLNQRAGCLVKVCEAIDCFRRSGVPGVTEANVQCEVGFPFEAVLGKNVISGLKDLVIP